MMLFWDFRVGSVDKIVALSSETLNGIAPLYKYIITLIGGTCSI